MSWGTKDSPWSSELSEIAQADPPTFADEIGQVDPPTFAQVDPPTFAQVDPPTFAEMGLEGEWPKYTVRFSAFPPKKTFWNLKVRLVKGGAKYRGYASGYHYASDIPNQLLVSLMKEGYKYNIIRTYSEPKYIVGFSAFPPKKTFWNLKVRLVKGGAKYSGYRKPYHYASDISQQLLISLMKEGYEYKIFGKR